MYANLICLWQRLFNQCGLEAQNEFEGMVILNGLSFSEEYQGLNESFFLNHVEVAEILDCLWIRGMAIYWL